MEFITESISLRVVFSGTELFIVAVIDAVVRSDETTMPLANWFSSKVLPSCRIPAVSEGIPFIKGSTVIIPSSLEMLLTVKGDIRLLTPLILDIDLSIALI